MERLIICLLIGYVFGLFQSGYLVGKIHHIDIRKHGSGNAGSTNALRRDGIESRNYDIRRRCAEVFCSSATVRALSWK